MQSDRKSKERRRFKAEHNEHRRYGLSDSKPSDSPPPAYELMTLSKQCQKVYDYLAAHPGCTVLDIIRNTGVTYASGRIAELPKAGVPIVVIGKKQCAGARPSKLLAVRQASLDTLPLPGLLSE